MISEKLAEAKALIEKGWTQGKFVTPAGRRYCAMGAINAVYGKEPSDCSYFYAEDDGKNDNSSAFCLVGRALQEVLHEDHSFLSRLNDSPTTKKEDIVAAFEKAIAKAQEQGR